MATKVNENTELSMPIRNLIAMVVGAAIGTWAYFGIIERLNNLENKFQIQDADVGMNTEFRIKWPRGQLGSLPADSEQFMMIEDLYKTTDKLNKHIENMALNKVNIEFLRKQMDKVLQDIEKLKDANRDLGYKNGAYND